MQTNEIASLLVDCAAQAATSVPVCADSALFGTTLTEALATMDGQNLPVEKPENPEELSTESAEAGNCLALTWNISPLLVTPPDTNAPPSTPTPTAAPATVAALASKTVQAPQGDAVPEAAHVPELKLGTPAPEPTLKAKTETAEIPESSRVPAEIPGPTVQAEVHREAVKNPVEKNVENAPSAKKEKHLARFVEKRAALTPPAENDAPSVPETNQDLSGNPGTPVKMAQAEATEVPAPNVAPLTPVQEISTPHADSPNTATIPPTLASSFPSDLQGEAKPILTDLPVAPRNLESVKPAQSGDDPVPESDSAPAPAPQPAMIPSRDAKEESLPHLVKAIRGREGSARSGRVEISNRNTPERSENSAPIVAAENHAENKGTTNSQSEKDRKQEPAAEIFQTVIHRAVASSNAPSTEELKPPASGTQVQTPIEPAAIHRAMTNLSGYSSTVTPTEVLTEPQKANVISQIVDKAQLLVKENNSEIVVALKPDSLGRITLRASMVNNELVTTIVAESHAVREVLQAELPMLHSVLQESGVDTAKVIVSREADMNFAGGASSNAFNFHQSHYSNQQQGRSSHGFDPYPWLNPESSNTETVPVQIPLDSRYAARSIHFIA